MDRDARGAREEELIEICLEVGAEHDGLRLDHFIRARIPRLSRARIQRMIRAQALLGAMALRPSRRVQAGQRVQLLRPAPEEPDVPLHYRTLYEDDALLAIDKPAGLPVHATARFHRHTLTALLRQQYGPACAPRLVHRIDRETSGVMLLAKDPRVEVALKGQLARREVHKRYLAIARGAFAEGETLIDLPIGADSEWGIRVKRAVVSSGQAARTRCRLLERRGEHALVEARPETGRQHQIRVHLSAIGCPIVGDKLYGPDPTCLLEYMDTGWSASLAARLMLPRHALHAADVTFWHPISRRELSVSCPLAGDLQAYWDSLLSG